MDFIDISKKRKTVRKFAQTPVKQELIDKMLEAASLDLGSVWISFFDENKAKKLLNIPENWQPVCMLYVGYPAKDFEPNTHLGGHRKPLNETCFYNTAPKEW